MRQGDVGKCVIYSRTKTKITTKIAQTLVPPLITAMPAFAVAGVLVLLLVGVGDDSKLVDRGKLVLLLVEIVRPSDKGVLLVELVGSRELVVLDGIVDSEELVVLDEITGSEESVVLVGGTGGSLKIVVFPGVLVFNGRLLSKTDSVVGSSRFRRCPRYPD